jgi:hypothetical protein
MLPLVVAIPAPPQVRRRFAAGGSRIRTSVPRERNGEKAKEPVSLVERKVPEMSGTGRRLSIFTSGFSRD